jgi:hypothetical protein
MATGAAGNTNTSVSGLLKRWYKDGGVILTTFQNRPYWAMITKKADSSEVEGSTFQFAIQTNDNQSRNQLFSGSQSQGQGLSAYNVNALTGTVAGPPGVGAIGVTQFSVPRVFNYTYANISTELMLSSRTKRGAFDNAVTRLTDSSLNVLGNDQEISLFGGSITSAGISTQNSGFLSQISTSNGSVSSGAGILTLQNAFDVNKFSANQELDLYWNNSGTITKRTNVAGNGLFVGSINRTLGTLSIVNAAGSAIAITAVFSDAAIGDFICVSNDFNGGASTGVQGTGKINSFESWCPFGGPVADSNSNLFCGVNRNLGDVTRLAGNWLDATGGLGPNVGTTLNIEDAIITMTQLVAMQSSGKEIDTLAMNYNQYTRLLKTNMSRTTLPGGAVQTNIPELSFKGIEVDTASGPAMVMPDRFCGTNRIYGLYMPSWSYIHLGDPVEMNTLDGNQGLREANLDAIAYRFFSFGNTVCDEPSANITCNIAP